MIQLYDTLHQEKREFKPLNPPAVSMYVCGVTVYDVCHIGHARAYVVFDMLKRHLVGSGYTVNHIQNFTDIDDKIIRKAAEQDVPITTITERYTQTFFDDMAALNIQPANHYPKATEHIAEIIALIERLLHVGAAFVHANGDVLFSTAAFDGYGKLSKKVLDDLEAGHRETAHSIESPSLDFVLWKQSKPGEPAWPSPWGSGRPGWHIECSAMAMQYLGEQIDIHGGGEDLVFPHHENEIAQCESCTGKPFVQYWIHNGFVTLHRQKMSKSLNNTITIRDLLNTVDPGAIRLYLLRTHYRTPFQFSWDGLEETKRSLHKLRACLADPETQAPTAIQAAELDHLHQRFTQALDDDINTAMAVGVCFEIVRYIQTQGVGRRVLENCLDYLGIAYAMETSETPALPAVCEALMAERETARAQKDFKRSDQLRDELLAHGIVVKDARDGTTWEWVKG